MQTHIVRGMCTCPLSLAIFVIVGLVHLATPSAAWRRELAKKQCDLSLPAHYDSLVTPFRVDAETGRVDPAVVEVDLILNSVARINDRERLMEVTASALYAWEDHRLLDIRKLWVRGVFFLAGLFKEEGTNIETSSLSQDPHKIYNMAGFSSA